MTAPIASLQDVATAHIAKLTKELKEVQGRSSAILHMYDKAKLERGRLHDKLMDYQEQS